MHTYTIKTEAVSATYSAKTADEAAAKFAKEEGYDANTLNDLAAEIDGIEGGKLIVHEDDVLVIMAGDY